MSKRVVIEVPDDLNGEAVTAYVRREQTRVAADAAILKDLYGAGWADDITDDDRQRAARLHGLEQGAA